MKTFRTIFPGHNSSLRIDHDQHLFLIGSCFSANIGAKLESAGFRVLNNPFGTLFNPGSIQMGLQRILSKHYVEKEDMFLHEGLWRSFLFHSSLSSPDLNECITHTNKIIKEAHNFLKK